MVLGHYGFLAASVKFLNCSRLGRFPLAVESKGSSVEALHQLLRNRWSTCTRCSIWPDLQPFAVSILSLSRPQQRSFWCMHTFNLFKSLFPVKIGFLFSSPEDWFILKAQWDLHILTSFADQNALARNRLLDEAIFFDFLSWEYCYCVQRGLDWPSWFQFAQLWPCSWCAGGQLDLLEAQVLHLSTKMLFLFYLRQYLFYINIVINVSL